MPEAEEKSDGQEFGFLMFQTANPIRKTPVN
jgi:hypothetical protein